MRIVPRLSLARRARVSNPAGKRIRVIVLFSAVAVASGLEIASASSGSFRGLLLRGLVVSGGRAVEALIPPVPNHNVAPIAPAATLSDTQLNIARHAHTATRLTDGKVLIVGGENSDGFVTPAEIFDPATGTFAVSANLNTPRADHTATRLSDGQVLIAGGRGGLGSLSSTEIFDPTSRAFTNGPNLNSARSGQSATALSDGRIAFAGGDAAGSIEIYDPQVNTFSAISARLLTPRAFHSAAAFSLLVGDQQTEKVLIIGGSAPDGTPLKSGEVFDVASSSFSSVSNESTDDHISALLRVLPDSKVQIIGGTDHEVMEIYDPGANIFGAHAHVFPIGDIHPALLQEILDAPARAALFHLGAASALLNREGQTITELPATNQALVAGGVDSSGNNLSSASVLNSSPASVTTDKLDYPPGTPVIVTGAGWQTNEVVTLMFHEDPHVGTENPHIFNVQADADGNFVCQEYAPEGQDAGVTYILGAKGGTSGWSAQTAFTDTTDPVAQTLPYSQDFSALASNSTTYPAGWQGWQLSTSGSSGSFRTTAATADLALTASSSASTTAGGVHNYNGKIGILASGSSDPALALAINTTGHSNVTASFDIMTIRNPYDGGSNMRISQVDLQYRVGTSGPFASVSGNSNGVYQNNTTTQTGSGVTTPQNLQSVNLTLPSGCDNQAVAQLRWVQRDFSGAGSRPSFAVDNVLVCPGVGAAGTITGSSTVCSGAMGVTYSITSVTGATTYDWSVPTGATITSGQGTTSITVNFGSSSGNVTVVPKNTCNSGTSARLVVAVNSPPNITVPPVSVSDACFGSSVNFSLTATGTSLTYQWRRNGSPLSNGGNISGADTATLTINPAGTGDAGSFDVVVSGACAPSATSDPATLTVLANSPPTVNSFTAGTAALPSAFAIDYINASTGDTLLLGATATDPNTACGDSVASFQWTINGHTTSTPMGSLSINWSTLQSTYGIVASGSGTTYPLSVKAFDTFNEPSLSAAGTLTVYQNVLVPSLVVGAATCSQPTSFDGSASHNNDPRISIVSYTFDFGDGTSTYTETAGSFPDGLFDGKTTHTYAHTGLYNAVLTVIDANGQNGQTTIPVNVTIEAPSVNSQPVAVSESCPGSPASFSVGATGTNLTYQWRRGGIPLSNGGNITGATSATLTINPVSIGDAGSYDVVVSGDCESSKASTPATLSIDSLAPTFTTPPVDHAAFAGMSCEALVPDFTAGVVASDNCSVTLTQSPTVGTSLGPGHHMVRVTATDGANNSSFFDVFFDVTDNTPPSITAPPDVVVNANGSCAATGLSLGSPIVGDNCSGVGVPTNNAPSTFPLGDTTVTWSVMDGAGHTSTATQKVTVNDNANPVAVSKNVTVNLSSTAPGMVTVNATDINNGSTDNCSISQYRIKKAGASDASYSSSVTFGCGETGDQAVVLKVIDAAGNSSTSNATVTVVDNTPPVAQSKSISRTFGLDGMVTVGPLDINDGSTDNCAITEYKIKKAAGAGFADSVTFGCGDAGPQSVTLRVKDAAGNTHTSANTVTVNKRVTVLSYTGPVTAVYGSMVTLTATLRDSATTTGIQGRTVVFTIGTQSVNATTDSSGVATAGLTLTQNIGNDTVQADFAGDCTFMSSGDSRLFAITPSCVTPIQQREYTGTLFAWTTSPTSSTATLTLGAGLKACTGDIRTARVSFAIRNGATWSLLPGATNVPVGPVDPGDFSQGTATAIVQYNIGSASAADLEVAIIVSGNYAQNDPSQDALVTIAKPPTMSSITGGGETANLTDSRGFVRGANGDITQFFLNVTYNKKISNPQGRVTVLVHSMNNPDGSPALSMRTYKITSTAISVLAADPNKGTASFSSKATLQDITDPLNPIAIDGGATLQVEITDGMKGAGTNPALGDTISIYLLNKGGGVWFVNKLDANLRAVQVPVISGTGDIVVK